ncbi:MAG: complex I subunit 1 family protein [Candidatus Ratteibacteria bacterium]|jgi:NADH-quinone oxidoreductase subunit H
MILYILPLLGFLFFAILGMLSSSIDRKIVGRIQWRVGPPWWQSFADFFKLIQKETLLPEGSQKVLFLLAPFLGLVGLIAVASIITGLFFGIPGDMITVIYCLLLPSLSLLLGGASSANVLATIGVAREMKLLIGYELPFIISLLVPVIKSGSFYLDDLLQWQQSSGAFALSLSGFIAFFTALISLIAKLGYTPFDIAEAETELAGGIIIEYSGRLLAVFKLMKWLLLSVGIFLLVLLFFNAEKNALFIILKYLGVLFLISLIRSTNPRLRIDQALTFFWRWLLLISIFAATLAFIGI